MSDDDDDNNTVDNVEEKSETVSEWCNAQRATTLTLDDLPVKSLSETDKILEPSEGLDETLYPCPNCNRTFLKKALERHVKICRKVFDTPKKRGQGTTTPKTFVPRTPPPPSHSPLKKKSIKPSDEFRACKFCSRKFGPKAYDRHVSWCEEKSRRIQDSPNKDMIALAKLHTRLNYRPNTPRRKNSDENSNCSSSRKESLSSITTTTDSSFDFGSPNNTRSLSRSSIRKYSDGYSSLGRTTGISYINDAKHTVENEDIQFIRAVTGRGSIKRPAQTKASQLRQLQQEANKAKSDQQAPIYAPRRPAVTTTTTTIHRKASQPQPSQPPQPPPQNVVRPHVVRPLQTREQPEGGYDHSAEYDPYQTAAHQMQELLFGNTQNDLLRPSTNSAFQKYIPDPVSPIPMTTSAFIVPPRTANPWSSTYDNNRNHHQRSFNTAKMAKFCHECGSPYPLAHIRFCCECGIKRLYL